MRRSLQHSEYAENSARKRDGKTHKTRPLQPGQNLAFVVSKTLTMPIRATRIVR